MTRRLSSKSTKSSFAPHPSSRLPILNGTYFPWHVRGVDHAEESGEDVSKDVGKGEEEDQEWDTEEQVGRLDAGLCLDFLEDGDVWEIFVDVCEDRAD